MLAKAVERKVVGAMWLAGALLLALFAASLRQGWLTPLDETVEDFWFRLEGPVAPIERVALVELDEATLDAYPDDPLVFWTPHFAKATATLRAAGAKVIGIDFDFSISPEQWLARIVGPDSRGARAYDQAFRRELASGQIVLSGQQLNVEPRLASGDFLAALPNVDLRRHVGAADLSFDSDGVLRRMSPLAPGGRQAGANDLRLLTFPLLLALHGSGQSPDAGHWMFGRRSVSERDPAWRIVWSGPPRTVTRISMRDLLAPDALQQPRIQALRDKVIILGVGYGGSNDVHLTPYSHGVLATRLMSGPEIHAHAIEALLQGRFLADPEESVWLLLLLALLAGGALLWRRLPVGRGSAALGLLLVLVLAGGWAGKATGIFVPQAHLALFLVAWFASLYGIRFSFGERERGRIRDLFSRYVANDVVEALLDSPELARLGGTALPVTVLFSDIRNFTSISERLAPEEVVEMLNRWFEQACAIVQQQGGLLDKFIGDAIMVEFGAPLPQSDHARRAIRAALLLVEAAAEQRQWMQTRFAGRELPPFAIGVGLNSGSAVVGNIGSSLRMEYTAIGDTVNLASRLEGETKTLGCAIVASDTTLQLAGSGVETGQHAVVTVKGRQEPVAIFEIVRMKEST